MVNNVEELIEQANLIESESERVEFVMNYFLKTVQYDYAYLMAKGYMQETISGVDCKKDGKDIIEVNPFKKGKKTISNNGTSQDFDDSFCFSYDISSGNSMLLNKIIELSNNINGDKDEFILSLYDVLIEELRKHLENDTLVSDNIFKLVKKIDKDMSLGIIRTTNDQKKYFISNNIKKVLLSYMLEPNIFFPVQIENGLIKNGVCQHYADYLQNLFDKIGIASIRIDGTSLMGHAWLGAIIDGELKSIDLTRAVFIRDGFKGIPPEQKSSDWLINDFEKTFEMQNTRTITEVGLDKNRKSVPLPYVMDGKNFDRDIIINLILDRYNNIMSNKTKLN